MSGARSGTREALSKFAGVLGGVLGCLLGVGCSSCAGRGAPEDAGLPDGGVPTVLLPAGTIAGPLVVLGDVIFEGVGETLTLVQAPAEGPALRVPAGVRVTVRGLTFLGAPGARAHTVVVEGSLVGERLEVRGGRAAFWIEGEADLSFVVVRDAEAALRVVGPEGGVGAEVSARDLLAETCSAAAYFVANGTLRGTRLGARGCEYGLLTRPEGRVEIDGLEIRAATYAAIGLVGGAGTLRGVVIEGPTPAGGVLANDLLVPAIFEDLTITGVAGVGVQVIRGDATFRRTAITEITADGSGALGMGVYFQASTARLAGATLGGNAGVGIVATAGSTVVVTDGDLRTNLQGSATAECATGAKVRLAAAVLADAPLAPCVTRF